MNHALAKSCCITHEDGSIITAPFIWLLTYATEFLLKILIKPNTDGNVTEEEIKAFIREGTEGGVQEIEQDIVERVFHIGDRKVNFDDP
jgi:putative hemolysin